MLQHFSELIDKVKAMPRTVVCVANADSETVEAAPVVMTSRSEPPSAKLYATALGCLAARNA